ncbi:MAG: amino acid adenylation domain-containing protein [Nostoc sp. DedQUE05]|uniref:non-ribosomal peptide synthetase n=1 Tax=Nostoc sp. DedQUE05 TaxID=3075391 RepID=UPI002AD2028A|nr:amino acid adenylation domain-containing protein [Nostoc sp. DedQUE05]MDZ8091511.1 amino acid adenylation domain-containing protein [Nostoc sp. DedQUE05]
MIDHSNFTSWNLNTGLSSSLMGTSESPVKATSEVTLIHLVLDAAERHPNAVALEIGNAKLTYEQLVKYAQAVACWLHSQNVSTEDRICIIADRQLGVYSAMLGVLMARAAYVPLNPMLPETLINKLIERTGAKVIITDAETWTRIEGHGITGLLVDEPLPFQAITVRSGILATIWSLDTDASIQLPQPSPKDLAYVIFTSGSTGTPKGVMVEHGSITNLIDWVRDTMKIGPASRVTQNASLFFDASVQQIFTAWAAGATLLPIPEGERVDGVRLLSWLREHRITHWDSIPTLWSKVVAVAAEAIAQGQRLLPDLEVILLAGEPLNSADVNCWRSWEQGHRLFNIYGPTEATVDATYYEISRMIESAIVPIGQPLPGVGCHILDAHGQPCPPHVDGELYLEGKCLARGYLGETQTTEQHFIVCSPGDHPNVRLYRTGDIVRLTSSNDLVYVGRRDDQIKVNGVRVEPFEIEYALCQHPSVEKAIAIVVPRDNRRDHELVALVRTGSDVRPEDIRSYAAKLLAPALVPSRVIITEDIPITNNGKINRRACREIALASHEQVRNEDTPVLSVTENTLLEVCKQLLNRNIGPDDDLFQAGADSITIIRLRHACVNIGFSIRGTDVFLHNTVRKLARFITDNCVRLETQTRENYSGVCVTEVTQIFTDQLPLLPSQRAILATTLLQDSSSVQVGLVHEIHSYTFFLDSNALEATLEILIERHDALRIAVIIPDSGCPYQKVHKSTPIPFTIEDISSCESLSQEQAVRAISERELLKGFDLQHPPLLRLVAVQRKDKGTTLVWTMHHLVTDGWSWELLQREFARIYESIVSGNFRPMLPPTLSFCEFVQTTYTAPRAEDIEEMAAMFANATVVRLPRPSVASSAERRRGIERLQVPTEVHRKVLELQSQAGVMVSTIYLYAVASALSRILRERQLVIGLVSSGRNVQIAGVERLVGSLARTVPILVETQPGSPSDEILGQLQKCIGSIIALDGVDVDDLLSDMGISLNLRAPDVTFIFQNYDSGVNVVDYPVLPQLQPQVEEMLSAETAASPLSIVIHQLHMLVGTTMEMRIEYWPHQVEQEFVATVLRETMRVLHQMEV